MPSEMYDEALLASGVKRVPTYTICGSRSLGWVSTSVFGDACDYLDTSQSLMNTPTIGQTLYVVSTSASDTNGGANGANSVRIVYLDTNLVQQVATVNLNGTTQVAAGFNAKFIQWMEVATMGASVEQNAGVITISSTNGVATVATTFCKIAALGNKSLDGRYMVPASSTAYIIRWHASAISATMDTRLRAQMFTDDQLLSTVYHYVDRMFVPAGLLEHSELTMKVPAGAVIKVSAIPGAAAAGNKLDTSFDVTVYPRVL